MESQEDFSISCYATQVVGRDDCDFLLRLGIHNSPEHGLVLRTLISTARGILVAEDLNVLALGDLRKSATGCLLDIEADRTFVCSSLAHVNQRDLHRSRPLFLRLWVADALGSALWD